MLNSFLFVICHTQKVEVSKVNKQLGHMIQDPQSVKQTPQSPWQCEEKKGNDNDNW